MTIHLPAESVRRLLRVAEIARRPVDDVIAQLVDSGLPPLLEAVPDALRETLARMESLSSAALRERLLARAGAAESERYEELLEANADGSIDEAGRNTLRECRARADQLMFEKAYAAVLLKWRGEHVPSLAELEAAV